MPGPRQNSSSDIAILHPMLRCNYALCHPTFGRGRSYQCMSGWHCGSVVQQHRCALCGDRSKRDPKLQRAPHIRPRLPPVRQECGDAWTR